MESFQVTGVSFEGRQKAVRALEIGAVLLKYAINAQSHLLLAFASEASSRSYAVPIYVGSFCLMSLTAMQVKPS